MSDQRDEDGSDASPPGDGAGQTMQIDALVDADAVLEDAAGEGDYGPPEAAFDGPPIVSRAPPPLPKRGPKKSVVIGALAVVMVLSIGAAFAASSVLTPAVPVAPAVTAPAPAAPPAPIAEEPVAEAPVVEAPAAHGPVTIEEIEITGGSPAEEEDAGVE